MTKNFFQPITIVKIGIKFLLLNALCRKMKENLTVRKMNSLPPGVFVNSLCLTFGKFATRICIVQVV